MKRLLLLFMAMIFFATQGWSQTTLNEDFEGTNFPPDGWTRVTTQGSSFWKRHTCDSPIDLACASVDWASLGHTNYLITPKLVILSVQDSISFWVKTDEYYPGTSLNVLVSTSDNNIDSFSTTSLLTLSDFNVTTVWTKHTVSLSSYIGQDIYVAFQVVDDFGMTVMLDDIAGLQLFVPSCPSPSALTVSNPTVSGIDLSWTDDLGVIWNIEYMLATETDWNYSIPISGVANNYTFTGLDPATTYITRVQTDCGDELSE